MIFFILVEWIKSTKFTVIWIFRFNGIGHSNKNGHTVWRSRWSQLSNFWTKCHIHTLVSSIKYTTTIYSVLNTIVVQSVVTVKKFGYQRMRYPKKFYQPNLIRGVQRSTATGIHFILSQATRSGTCQNTFLRNATWCLRMTSVHHLNEPGMTRVILAHLFPSWYSRYNSYRGVIDDNISNTHPASHLGRRDMQFLFNWSAKTTQLDLRSILGT